MADFSELAYIRTYTDVYGIAPSFNKLHMWAHLTEAQKYRTYQALHDKMADTEDARREQAFIETFEMRVLNLALDNGIQNRADVIKGLMDIDDADSFEQMCYLNGLPYGYLGEDKK